MSNKSLKNVNSFTKKGKNIKKKPFKQKPNKNKAEKLLIEKLQEKYENIDSENISSFADLPLSPNTLKGLKECQYLTPTEVQKNTIKLSLMGKDILGAAKTGSGKTLAFIIPILEKLFCKQWTQLDGIGAIVITPTRELARQIFKTLKGVAKYHDFTFGSIVGGEGLKYEWDRMGKCNIIICTPGRLLQHMNENSSFDCVNMQMLVLDEADRCLDLGFQRDMNAIIANLPEVRQTLLFSATQTRSVKDLARLSLKDPSYISVHENAQHSTPQGLQQNYLICELKDKVSILWSFIKNHPKQKIIIFFASCKQAKFVYEMFTKLKVCGNLMALYGTLHQLRRTDIYESFIRKEFAILFATDIAARGLDFPEVHWVVQADCPEDSDTYIHRVGRTARYNRGGQSLLLLLQSEISMLNDLKAKKVPINEIEIDPSKLKNPLGLMRKELAKDLALSDTARRAFLSYVKSVAHMKNKEIFNVKTLDTASFAASLGLTREPRIRFLDRLSGKLINKNSTKTAFDDKTETKVQENNNGVESCSDDKLVEKMASKFQISQTKSKNNVVRSFAEFGTGKDNSGSESDDDEDAGNFKKEKLTNENTLTEQIKSKIEEKVETKLKKTKVITKAAAAKKLKGMTLNKKIIFDDEGQAVRKSKLGGEFENETVGGIDIEKSKLVLKEEDTIDKQLFKKKVNFKHKEEKRKLKEKKKEEEAEKDEYEDSNSAEEPDVSWLPDINKVYGKKDDIDDEEKMMEECVNFEEFQKLQKEANKEKETKSKKRKSKQSDEKSEKQIKRKKQKIAEISSSLNVRETEEIAMMLLQNK